MTGGPDPARRRRRPGPPDGDPSVFVADEQSAVAVDVGHLLTLAEAVLGAEGVQGECELSLYFLEEGPMAELNERFMGARGATDVLAFPIDEDVVDPGRSPDAGATGPDRAPVDPGDVPVLLGDVLICPAKTADVLEATVHGVLHLCGYDHETDEGEMLALQARVVSRL